MNRSPLSALGVFRLVPSRPPAREQMAAVVELALAAASGDASALERLLVLDDLLAHRITTDRATAAVSDREAESIATPAAVATIEKTAA